MGLIRKISQKRQVSTNTILKLRRTGQRFYSPQIVLGSVSYGLQPSMEAARKHLIQVTRDSRIPMAQIQQMFAGTMTPEEVLRVGEGKGDAASFYANLYVGLYYEALGRDDESLRLVTRAADNPAASKNYMGDVARVHVILRKKKATSTPVRGPKVAK